MCRNFQYKVGETFRHEGEITVCEKGFHFCQKIADCFNYYSFNSDNKVAEIKATGKIKTYGDKSVTDEIKIVREISWHEVLNLANEGKNCTGYHNAGNSNSGNHNSGDWNSCDFSNGFFNSISPPIYAFNKPLNTSRREFLEYDGVHILAERYTNNTWISAYKMTDEEKKTHPDYEAMGGYLKTVDFKTACKNMWDGPSMKEKQKVCEIPNFDASVFNEITGIDVTDGETDLLKRKKSTERSE